MFIFLFNFSISLFALYTTTESQPKYLDEIIFFFGDTPDLEILVEDDFAVKRTLKHDFDLQIL